MSESDEPIVIRDNREPGWFWSPNELLDIYGPIIGVYGIAVYMALARRADNTSQKTWPGLRSMAKTLGTGRRQVREAIEKLEAAGVITVERRPRQTHRYTLVNLRVQSQAGIPEAPPKEVAPPRPQVGPQGSHPGIPGEPELDLGTRLRELDRTELPKIDYLDLVLETKSAQDKLKRPITYLSETVADLLGLAKVPNYQYEERWESPLRDLLDQADNDIDRVEVALRTAAQEGRDNGMTMTTASSLHGLALKALAQTNGKNTTEDVEAREAAARAKMHELAREHGHE